MTAALNRDCSCVARGLAGGFLLSGNPATPRRRRPNAQAKRVSEKYRPAGGEDGARGSAGFPTATTFAIRRALTVARLTIVARVENECRRDRFGGHQKGQRDVVPCKDALEFSAENEGC